MKIALLGYGKMGQLVETFALSRMHSIVFRGNRDTVSSVPVSLFDADIAIDFSEASAVLSHLKICMALQIPIVIGTTGWEESLPDAKEAVNRSEGTCLYAPNFSEGAYLFGQIVRQTSGLMESFPDYDVAGIEYHHKHKKDSPSGTAKSLTRNIQEAMPRTPSSFAFTGIRCGSMPGTHTLVFDSPADTIVLTHEVRNRNDFASGAVSAAEWLQTKKGFFTFEDYMQEKLKGAIRET